MDEKEYRRKYYQEHKEEQQAYREIHKEKRKQYMKEWYAKNKIRQQELAREYRKQLRIEIISHYGRKCVCCGENRIEFLTIDHINDGGRKHRRSIGGPNRFYLWLKKNNYPKDYQVLCMNCNWAKRFGRCPHER